MKHLKLTWLFCFFLIVSSAFAANRMPKVLLINSDASVSKYGEVQEAFKEDIPHPVVGVNLGDEKWDMPSVENLLYDEYPDITYCIGSKAYHIASKYIGEKDIVFSSVLNWLRLPLTRKTYGVSNELHAEMQIMLFRYIFPDVRKVTMLYSKRYTQELFKNAKDKARNMGVEIAGEAVFKGRNTISAFDRLPADTDAFWLISDPEIISDKKGLSNILKRCEKRNLPFFSYHEAFVKLGAVLILSVDNPTIGRQAAGIAKRVLSGNKPAKNVEPPAGSHIILNMRKVKAYHLKYNENALGSVNSIVE